MSTSGGSLPIPREDRAPPRRAQATGLGRGDTTYRAALSCKQAPATSRSSRGGARPRRSFVRVGFRDV